MPTKKNASGGPTNLSLLFSIDEFRSDVGDLTDQHLHLPAEGIDLGKIGVYPLLQVLGFSNVDDFVFIIQELINPGFVRQPFDDVV